MTTKMSFVLAIKRKVTSHLLKKVYPFELVLNSGKKKAAAITACLAGLFKVELQSYYIFTINKYYEPFRPHMQSDALSPLNHGSLSLAKAMIELPRLALLTVLKRADKLRRASQ